MLDYKYSVISPAWDVVPFIPLCVLMLSLCCTITCNVIDLPVFIPNEYLYTTHANKGKERWEIYAWALREILADVGNFTKSDQPYRAKLQYEALMGQRENAQVRGTESEPLINDHEKQVEM